jgi:hypothetical protein
MTIQKRMWDLVVLAIVVFAAAFATAPWFAFRALKAAAQYEDVQAISELVDFPAVRRGLTDQLNDAVPAAAAPAEPPSIWRDPMGVFKRAIEPIAPPEPKVDRYLTVAGLSALTRGYAPGAAPPPPAKPPAVTDQIKAAVVGPHPTIAYWDPNRVRIKLFEWRLVHVRLPVDER